MNNLLLQLQCLPISTAHIACNISFSASHLFSPKAQKPDEPRDIHPDRAFYYVHISGNQRNHVPFGYPYGIPWRHWKLRMARANVRPRCVSGFALGSDRCGKSSTNRIWFGMKDWLGPRIFDKGHFNAHTLSV